MSVDLLHIFPADQQGKNAKATFTDTKTLSLECVVVGDADATALMHVTDVAVSRFYSRNRVAELSCSFNRCYMSKNAWDTISRLPMRSLSFSGINYNTTMSPTFYDLEAARAAITELDRILLEFAFGPAPPPVAAPEYYDMNMFCADDAAIVFTTLEKNNPAIRELNLHHAYLRGYNTPFPAFTSLDVLSIPDCQMKSDEMDFIARSLGSVTTLDVSANSISEAGGISIARNMRNLRILRARDCYLGGRGIAAICNAAIKSGIEELDLARNKFHDIDVVTSVLQMLLNTPRLTTFGFQSTMSFDVSRTIPSIAEAIGRTTILNVDFEENWGQSRPIIHDALRYAEARRGAFAFFAASVVRGKSAAQRFLLQDGDQSLARRVAGFLKARHRTPHEEAVFDATYELYLVYRQYSFRRKHHASKRTAADDLALYMDDREAKLETFTPAVRAAVEDIPPSDLARISGEYYEPVEDPPVGSPVGSPVGPPEGPPEGRL
jgi:hypothetical protein